MGFAVDKGPRQYGRDAFEQPVVTDEADERTDNQQVKEGEDRGGSEAFGAHQSGLAGRQPDQRQSRASNQHLIGRRGQVLAVMRMMANDERANSPDERRQPAAQRPIVDG